MYLQSELHVGSNDGGRRVGVKSYVFVGGKGVYSEGVDSKLGNEVSSWQGSKSGVAAMMDPSAILDFNLPHRLQPEACTFTFTFTEKALHLDPPCSTACFIQNYT